LRLEVALLSVENESLRLELVALGSELALHGGELGFEAFGRRRRRRRIGSVRDSAP
jgi:hypothetical protein